jgi:hypothetical protein
MSERLNEYIGIRSAALRERIDKVAEAKARKVRVKVTASDVVRECIEMHLPQLEFEYGLISKTRYRAHAPSNVTLNEADTQTTSKRSPKRGKS